VEGSLLTYTIGTGPAHGTLSGAAPNLIYTPAANYNGPDSFTFRANDGELDSNVATVSITVNAVNDAPVASSQAVVTDEDTAKAITLSASDVEGSALSYTIGTGPTHGTLTGTAPNLIYTPAANYNGPDSFTFTANDGELDSNLATVSITVNAVNDAPVASNQAVVTDEDTAKAITLGASDVEGSALSYTIGTGPTHGTLTGTAPNLTYTPAANYNGPDSFTFRANDGELDSNLATVSITVNPVNDAPIASDQAVATDGTPKAIVLSATDVEGSPLTYAIVTAPAHGTLSGTAPNVTYTPAASYNGPDSFTFTANDGQATSNVATVFITVANSNGTPVANSQSIQTPEDAAVDIMLTGIDPAGRPLRFRISRPPAHGRLSGGAPSLVYVPDANYNGPDSFTFHVVDGDLVSNDAVVSILITPVNDAPVASDLRFSTNGAAIDGQLIATDIDGNPLTYRIVSGPEKGTAVVNADGAFRYTPNGNRNGSDTFTYVANDGLVDSAPARVHIVVTGKQ
jgi:VCBS repeat-containing protein